MDIEANFSDIKDIYYKENGAPLKFAHKLSQKVVASKSIEKHA